MGINERLDDLYWEAQWAINVLEEQRAVDGLSNASDTALDVLLQL